MIIFQDKILMLVARGGSAVGTRMTKPCTHAEYFLFVRSMINVVLPSTASFHLSCQADFSEQG